MYNSCESIIERNNSLKYMESYAPVDSKTVM